jgi:hypothetical protein
MASPSPASSCSENIAAAISLTFEALTFLPLAFAETFFLPVVLFTVITVVRAWVFVDFFAAVRAGFFAVVVVVDDALGAVRFAGVFFVETFFALTFFVVLAAVFVALADFAAVFFAVPFVGVDFFTADFFVAVFFEVAFLLIFFAVVLEVAAVFLAVAFALKAFAPFFGVDLFVEEGAVFELRVEDD